MTITRNLFLLLSVLFFSSLSINAIAGPVCGDSTTDSPEECDEGNIAASNLCTNITTNQGNGECTLTFCSDGVIQPTNGNNSNEQCDDGNNTNGDGCDATCQNESQPVCGDGIVNGADQCDDGNTVDDDNCTNACTLPVCGDGIVNGIDQCDDLNLPTAVCDANCMTIAAATCGNGVVEAGEQCDDQNLPTATCNANCTTITAAVCGNGVVETGEQCDLLNLPTATCDTNCQTIAPPVAVCGNGIVETGEQCDDQNLPTATCDASCMTIAAPICGNGVVETGEQCDAQNLPTVTCDASCNTIVVIPPVDPSTVDAPLPGSGSVNIATGAGQTLSNVSVVPAVNGPADVDILFGVISYDTTTPVGGTQKVRLTFPSKMPDDGLVVYKVDNLGNFKQLPRSVWKRMDKKILDVFLTDGDPITDLDGIVNGVIVDPIAIGQFNDIGGCTIGGRSVFDPLWLLLFAVPAIGSLRNRARK